MNDIFHKDFRSSKDIEVAVQFLTTLDKAHTARPHNDVCAVYHVVKGVQGIKEFKFESSVHKVEAVL